MNGTLVRKTWQHDPALYAPAKYRKACHYDAFIPHLLTAATVQLPVEVAGVLSDAETAISSLNDTPSNALDPLARLLLRTESIGSSKVEGLQVSTRSLARAEVKRHAGTNLGRDTTEILGAMNAMRLAISRAAASRNIEVGDFKDIHAALLEQSYVVTPGQFRTSQNWIGGNGYNPCGADFVPPPKEEMSALLQDLCTFCNDDTAPPLVQAALAHAQFETIHPFEDGNGRTGRALIHIVLRRRGLAPNYVPPISVVLARNKDAYIQGLIAFREGRTGDWLETFAASAAAAARLAKRYLEQIVQLQNRWRDTLRLDGVRKDAAAWSIVELLPAHPVITPQTVATETGRSGPAVSNGLDQLLSAGILSLVSKSPKKRMWESAELISLIEGLEAGEPR